MTVSLGIRKQMARKVKAQAKAKAKAEKAAAKETPLEEVFKKRRLDNCNDLRMWCLRLNEEGDLDLEAERAINAAIELFHAIDDCNSETKDLVCAVVADVLVDETNGRWTPGATIHKYLTGSLASQGYFS
jgi:hypothetical protein